MLFFSWGNFDGCFYFTRDYKSVWITYLILIYVDEWYLLRKWSIYFRFSNLMEFRFWSILLWSLTFLCTCSYVPLLIFHFANLIFFPSLLVNLAWVCQQYWILSKNKLFVLLIPWGFFLCLFVLFCYYFIDFRLEFDYSLPSTPFKCDSSFLF